MDKIVKRLEAVSEFTGKTISWLTLAMVIVTFCIVVLRYVFNVGWIAVQESVNYMHSMVFMLGAAYAYKCGAHVRVDIFYSRFSPKKQALIDLSGNILFLIPVCIFIIIIDIDILMQSWRDKEGSRETGGLPYVYLLKTVIPIMAGLLIVQALADSLQQVQRLQNKGQH